MPDHFELIISDTALDSPFRGDRTQERPLRVGAVQCAWSPDASAHEATLREGVASAATEGAEVVLLQELTLSPYFCVAPDVTDALDRFAEDVESGPTVTLAR